MNDEAKYIYMARNPWDVCLSQYRMTTELSISQFQDGTFEEFFDPFIEGDLGYGDYFEHVAAGYALKDQPNVFFLTYEELKNDTRDVVLRLAYFLGECYGRALEADAKMLQNVLEWSKAENMKKVIVFELGESQTSDWNAVFTAKRVTSKHGVDGDNTKYALVKEARVGSWKDSFTPELLSRFEKKIQEEGDKASFMELWKDIRAEAIALSHLSE
ncbi:hypothetical protein V5799_022028 [Amblyomma americanum]|uniref:Sulfotransferase domain-containing protein n=1 Tax=Amblyomma americanum TaxID=6943 RepID=A0AAQ4FLM9_AMBAM